MKPRLLDLFCGAGGAAMGYHRAGFDVVGVDMQPQPRYPFLFVQADALEFVRRNGHHFDAIHASPPCQHYSQVTKANPGKAGGHPDLVAPTRAALVSTGRPHIIENVPNAPLLDPITLCGVMFPELRVYRHRLFESNLPLIAPAHTPHNDTCPGTRKRGTAAISPKGYITVTSGGGNTPYRRRAMGITWMTGDELAQAIPPAYTEYLGGQLLAYLAGVNQIAAD